MSKIETIGIIAPAGAIKDLEAYNNGVAYLKSLGLKVIEAANVHDSEELFAGADTWLPGSADRRIAAMMEIWSKPEVDAMISMRGGYGCIHLLNHLDYDYIAKHPKPLFGYSDLTVLFAALNAQAYKGKLQCFHTPMVSQLAELDDISRQSFEALLTNVDPQAYATANFRLSLQDILRLNPLLAQELSAQGSSVTEAKLMGGNLTLIASLLGTQYLPEFKAEVLLLEECLEPAYKVDRMMQQLDLVGVFSEIKELWIGKGWDAAYNYQHLETLASNYGFKLIRDLSIGHEQTKLSVALY